MANICEYNMIVKGRKNACYAFFAGQYWLNYKDITFESGNDERYEMHFSGTCKWTVDQYCITYNGSCPMDIPDDYEEAAKMMCGTEHYTVQSRSRMFDVEVWCNSRDSEGDPETAYYGHFISGSPCEDVVPEELVFEDTLYQECMDFEEYDDEFSECETDDKPDIPHSLSEMSICKNSADLIRKYFEINTVPKSDLYQIEEDEDGMRISFRDYSDNQILLSPAQLLVLAIVNPESVSEVTSLPYWDNLRVFEYEFRKELVNDIEYNFTSSSDNINTFLTELFTKTDFGYSCYMSYISIHDSGMCRLSSIIPEIQDFHFCTREELSMSGDGIDKLNIFEDETAILCFRNGKISISETYSNIWNDEKWKRILSRVDIKIIESLKSDYIKNLVLPVTCTALEEEALAELSALQSVTVMRSNTSFGEEQIRKFVTVKAKKGSSAQLFAEKNGCVFLPLENNTSETSVRLLDCIDVNVSSENKCFPGNSVWEAKVSGINYGDICSGNTFDISVRAHSLKLNEINQNAGGETSLKEDEIKKVVGESMVKSDDTSQSISQVLCENDKCTVILKCFFNATHVQMFCYSSFIWMLGFGVLIIKDDKILLISTGKTFDEESYEDFITAFYNFIKKIKINGEYLPLNELSEDFSDKESMIKRFEEYEKEITEAAEFNEKNREKPGTLACTDEVITVKDDFSITVPAGYYYSTDKEVIGRNRSFIIVKDGEKGFIDDSFSAEESYTALDSLSQHNFHSLHEAVAMDRIRNYIGLSLLNPDKIITVKHTRDIAVFSSCNEYNPEPEEGDDYAIYQILIITKRNLYTVQAFFNEYGTQEEFDQRVNRILSSITEKNDSPILSDVQEMYHNNKNEDEQIPFDGLYDDFLQDYKYICQYVSEYTITESIDLSVCAVNKSIFAPLYQILLDISEDEISEFCEKFCEYYYSSTEKAGISHEDAEKDLFLYTLPDLFKYSYQATINSFFCEEDEIDDIDAEINGFDAGTRWCFRDIAGSFLLDAAGYFGISLNKDNTQRKVESLLIKEIWPHDADEDYDDSIATRDDWEFCLCKDTKIRYVTGNKMHRTDDPNKYKAFGVDITDIVLNQANENTSEIIEQGPDHSLNVSSCILQPEEESESVSENAAVSTDITRTFVKGERIDITDSEEIIVELKSENGFSAAEADMYIFMLRENGKTAQDDDLIFFGNKSSEDGSVTEMSSDSEHCVSFIPSKLSDEIHRVIVCISAYGENENDNLSGLKNPFTEINTSDSSTSGKYVFEISSEKTIEVLEFYRHNGRIKMKIIGAGYKTGMDKLCEQYGIETE